MLFFLVHAFIKIINSIFEYNIFHSVSIYEDNINFKISNKYTFIAQSDKYIINFVITPQFNKLNYNNIILNCIFNNFLLVNTCKKYKNYERYKNKIIYACILSLDSIEPIFIKLDVDEKCEVIKNSIKTCILHEYSDKHKVIFHFYQFCKQNKPSNKNSIEFTYDEIIKQNKSKLPSDSLTMPKYIENYFYDISEQIKKNNKDKNKIDNIMLKFNDIESFLEDIKEYLIDAIDEYIEDKNEVIDF